MDTIAEEGTRFMSHSKSPTRLTSRSLSRSYSRSRSFSRSYSRSYSPSPEKIREHQPFKSKKIIIKKLTKNVTPDHLYEIFGRYGKIRFLDMPPDRDTNGHCGVAYITYEEISDAENALECMNGGQLDGNTLIITFVDEMMRRRAPFRRLSGGFMGRRFFNRNRGRRNFYSPPRRYGRFRKYSPPRRNRYDSRSISRSPSRSYSRSRSPSYSRSRSRSYSRSRSPYSRSRSYSRSLSRSLSYSPRRD